MLAKYGTPTQFHEERGGDGESQGDEVFHGTELNTNNGAYHEQCVCKQ